MLELIGLWGIALFSLLGVCDNIGSCYTNNNNLEPVNQSHSHGHSYNRSDNQQSTVTKYIMALRPSGRASEGEGEGQCQNQTSTLNSTCVICLEGFDENENENQNTTTTTTTTTLICKHRYHLSCIRSWLSKNDECPLCMQVVVCDSKESIHSTHTLFN